LSDSVIASPYGVVRYRYLFAFALFVTLVVLTVPGPIVDALHAWVLSWWPWRGSGMNSGAVSFDKFVHLALFGLCGWTIVRGWMTSARGWLVFYIPLLAFGVATEIVQHFVPGRGADPMDLVADGVGALFGMALAWRRVKGGVV